MYAPSKIVKITLFTAATFFLVLLIICPLLQPENTIRDLTGHVGIVDNIGVISNLSFPCKQVYIFGDVWCHQMGERSFFIIGNQMPLCARCFGTFIGIPFGMLLSIAVGVRIDDDLHKKVLAVLLIGYCPIFTDYVGQTLGIWHSINPVRVATGALAGASFGIILGMLIDVIGKYVFRERT